MNLFGDFLSTFSISTVVLTNFLQCFFSREFYEIKWFSLNQMHSTLWVFFGEYLAGEHPAKA